MQPDQLDQQIIDILRNGMVPNSEIARRLGVVEGTIRLRVKRLREAGILTMKALINPEVLHDKQLALIAVNVAESRLLQEKALELQALPEVMSVAIVSGQFDMLLEVLTESNSGLVNFITERLSQVEGVRTTQSFIFLRTYNKYV